MTNETIVPTCYNCICVPICKFKCYHDLYIDCILLRHYLSWYLQNMDEDDDRSSPFLLIYNVLKPTEWTVNSSGNVVTNKGYWK